MVHRELVQHTVLQQLHMPAVYKWYLLPRTGQRTTTSAMPQRRAGAWCQQEIWTHHNWGAQDIHHGLRVQLKNLPAQQWRKPADLRGRQQQLLCKLPGERLL